MKILQSNSVEVLSYSTKIEDTEGNNLSSLIRILTVLTFPFITNLTTISIRSNFDGDDSDNEYAENAEDDDNADYYEDDYNDDYYDSSFYDTAGYGYRDY